eukprot:6210662-Pleurochrysis_carterae.AAC.1
MLNSLRVHLPSFPPSALSSPSLQAASKPDATNSSLQVLRPYPPAEDFAFRPLVPPLFSTVKGRLTAQDQDQEVKECAIVCMGTAICHLGDAC